MIRWILRIATALVILLVVVGVTAWIWIDSIAKTAVEKGTTYAAGVDTKVDSIHVGLLAGEVELNGLRLANPEGFTSEHLLKSGKFQIAVDSGTLLSDTIEVKIFELDGLDLNFEQTLSGSNVSKVIENLKRFQTPGEKPTEPAPSGKKVHVGQVTIRNVAAHFHLPAGASDQPITVKVPELVLTDVASDEGGVAVSRLAARLLPAIFAAVLEQARGTVPSQYLTGLDGQLSDLSSLMSQQGQQLLQKAGKSVTDLLKGTSNKDANSSVLDKVGGLLKG